MPQTLEQKRAKHAAYMKKWIAAHPEYRDARKEYMKQYYAANTEIMRGRASQWAIDNIDRKKATKARYYQNNKDKHRTWAKNRDPDKEKARVQKWIENNYERHLELHRRACIKRRARLRGTEMGPVDYEAVIARAACRCTICGEALTGPYEYDHVIPLSRGGRHATDNLQLTHKLCNRRKGTSLA